MKDIKTKIGEERTLIINEIIETLKKEYPNIDLYKAKQALKLSSYDELQRTYQAFSCFGAQNIFEVIKEEVEGKERNKRNE